MSNLVIVALPREDDPIYKISSEKVPHLTLLFMGPSDHESQIALFLQHAANVSLTRFGLDVDRRGTLGPDNADVIFFQDNWELPRVTQFRDILLKNNLIRSAYDTVDQHTVPQEWIPHLTLGYPDKPAKPTSERIYWIQFDRVALWDGEYSGPEFTLQSEQYPMEAMMADTSAVGRQFLAHHGVLGMKWGHRRATSEVSAKQSQTIIRGKAKVKTAGGEGLPAHPDAVKVAGHRQILKKSGMSALSNQQLKDMQDRMQLESNVGRLHSETQAAGKKFVKRFVGEQAKGAANAIGREAVNQVIKEGKKKAHK